VRLYVFDLLHLDRGHGHRRGSRATEEAGTGLGEQRSSQRPDRQPDRSRGVDAEWATEICPARLAARPRSTLSHGIQPRSGFNADSTPPGRAEELAARGAESGQGDGDQAVDGVLVGDGAGCGEGVQAVRGQFVRGQVVADVAVSGGLGDQVLNEAA
jgi:hypothetical protein